MEPRIEFGAHAFEIPQHPDLIITTDWQPVDASAQELLGFTLGLYSQEFAALIK